MSETTITVTCERRGSRGEFHGEDTFDVPAESPIGTIMQSHRTHRVAITHEDGSTEVYTKVPPLFEVVGVLSVEV